MPESDISITYLEPNHCLVCGGIQFGIHYHDLTEGDDDDGMDD